MRIIYVIRGMLFGAQYIHKFKNASQCLVDMADYENMLDKARDKLPEHILKSERFEIPKVIGHIQGNRTIISNFSHIADSLRRPVAHLQKYILKELATPGNLTKTALIIGRKVSASMINQKILQYADLVVFCKECKKADTKMEKDGDVTSIKCMVCGAKHPVNARI
ncbi:MAG: translation initiation factor 2 subunit 2 [archaeon GW2011_AR3]|nr:MAG: translation initiation factor 2 subunit 2 [archaeon GW2011_AR3]